MSIAENFILALNEAFSKGNISIEQFKNYLKKVYNPLVNPTIKNKSDIETMALNLIEDLDNEPKPEPVKKPAPKPKPTSVQFFGDNSIAEINIYTGQDERTNVFTFDQTYSDYIPSIVAELENVGSRMKNIKYTMYMKVIFSRYEPKEEKNQYTTTKLPKLSDEDISSFQHKVIGNKVRDYIKYLGEDRFKYSSKIEDFMKNGSGFRFVCITKFNINVARYNPVGTGSYIPTPSWISLKKATINIKNKDEQCFKWALLCSVFLEELKGTIKNESKYHFDRVSIWKQFENRFNFNGLNYPVINEDIEKFEEFNDSLCVVVLTYDEQGKIIPDYISNR